MNYGYIDMSHPKETLTCLFHVFAGVMAAYIAYNRNKNEGPLVAVTMAVLAFMFGFLYLLYIMAAVVLQDPAYKGVYGMSEASNEILGAYSKLVQDAAK
jgi:hypothetical protein